MSENGKRRQIYNKYISYQRNGNQIITNKIFYLYIKPSLIENLVTLQGKALSIDCMFLSYHVCISK